MPALQADNPMTEDGMLTGKPAPLERILLTQNQDDAASRAAGLLAQALNELYQAAASEAGVSREDLAESRAALQALAQRLEQQLAEEKLQRAQLAGQLTNLAGSLDRLVNHLHGLSQLMADLLERLAAPSEPSTPELPASEPTFQPGGEGISLTLSAVPGFQALMDIQKALIAIEQVSGASVERFQEGDSRVLVQLRSPITAARPRRHADAQPPATSSPSKSRARSSCASASKSSPDPTPLTFHWHTGIRAGCRAYGHAVFASTSRDCHSEDTRRTVGTQLQLRPPAPRLPACPPAR